MGDLLDDMEIRAANVTPEVGLQLATRAGLNLLRFSIAVDFDRANPLWRRIQSGLPEGIVHLAEHILMRRRHILCSNTLALGANIGARVTPEGILWAVKVAIQGSEAHTSVCRMMDDLIGLIGSKEVPALRLGDELEHAKWDVRNEMMDRRRDRNFQMRSRVLSALFAHNSQGFDTLGSPESISAVREDQIRLVLDIAPRRISSIVVYGPSWSEGAYRFLLDHARELLSKCSTSAAFVGSWQLAPQPSVLPLQCLGYVEPNLEDSLVAHSGISLNDSRTLSPHDFLTKASINVVATKLAPHRSRIAGVSARLAHSIAYFVQTSLTGDPLLFLDDAKVERLAKQLRCEIYARLKWLAANFPALSDNISSKLLEEPQLLMEIGHIMNSRKLGLTDFLRELPRLDPRLFAALAEDIMDSRHPQVIVFAGRHADLV